MAHDSMGYMKLLNRDLLRTVNITENFRFHNVGVQRRVRELFKLFWNQQTYLCESA